ncbi:NACHT, LRR and PYD domains-containing protein 3-like isoform X1 [Acipenser oxyrinchus oxyrinchus]|uniref:NACHT, LRR and PYD domains-containing protein 3-like isoform X1 n=1 Tax=Acipenser oxyrinchus oxyrinchus TaxID=40147 RepID=A0AAD8GGS8_ACIOX|nr:NACHT, LRR and PYD domains-containing protein 3-like isoform X1 [Acipenser oxyrinchus oxyrinchus]
MGDQKEPVALLRKWKVALIEVLSMDPSPVLQHSDSRGLLSRLQYNKIKAIQDPAEKIESLLDLIIDKGNGMAQVFLELLKIVQKDYPRLPSELIGGSDVLCDLQTAKKKHKHCVIRDNGKIVEYNSLPWESVLISERYTPLLMVEYQKPFEDTVQELMGRGSYQAKAMVRNKSKVSLEHLFQTKGDFQNPKLLILLGVAGVGKTTLVQKLMMDWALGKLYQDNFDFVFCLKCRELNLLTGKQSLVDVLLLNHNYLLPSIGQILKHPEKILIVIDGFDEFRFPICQPQHQLCTKTDEPRNTDNLLASLLRRGLLPEACLILTTRPSALEQMKVIKADGCFEILGFPEEHREEYFQHFFADEAVAAQAFQHIKENEVVYTMCYIPIFCWIVCTVLKEQGKFGNNYPQTATEIFVHFIIISVKYHNFSGQTGLRACLQKLSKLAFCGVQENRIIFYPEEFKAAGLELQDMTSLFCTEILMKEVVGTFSVYSFIHLTVQEFLAALSFFICDNCTLESFYDLDITLRFLFGLTNPSSQNQLAHHIGPFSPAATAQANHWLQGNIALYTTGAWSGEFFMKLLYALFEKNDARVTKEALATATSIGLPSTPLSKVDCLVIRNVFQQGNVPSNMEFNLEGGDLSDGLHVLAPVLHKFGRLFFHENPIGDKSVVHLYPVLQRTDCQISFLDLMDTGITDEGMPGLSAAIAQNNSIKELDLWGNGITDKSIQHIHHMALNCPTLETIALHDEKFSKTGRQRLDNLTSVKPSFKVQWSMNDYCW